MPFENIRRLCVERGITLYQLAKACGLDGSAANKWATSMPKADTLKKVADYFGVTMDELMTEPQED